MRVDGEVGLQEGDADGGNGENWRWCWWLNDCLMVKMMMVMMMVVMMKSVEGSGHDEDHGA